MNRSTTRLKLQRWHTPELAEMAQGNGDELREQRAADDWT
jgi:hypothetical protein